MKTSAPPAYNAPTTFWFCPLVKEQRVTWPLEAERGDPRDQVRSAGITVAATHGWRYVFELLLPARCSRATRPKGPGRGA